MMTKPKANKSYPLLGLQVCVGVLFLVYVSIFLFPPGLISHSEHDHLGQSDRALEADPCHISMYHPGVLGGCHHKYHFTKDHGDCPLCHVTLVRQMVSDPIQGIEMVYFIIKFEIHGPEGGVINFPILHDDRGPPASSII